MSAPLLLPMGEYKTLILPEGALLSWIIEQVLGPSSSVA
jgi:hypothetical protein